MTSPAALSDRTKNYQAAVRVVYADLRTCLDRVDRRFREGESDLTERTAEHIRHLRLLVDMVGRPPLGPISQWGSTRIMRPAPAPMLDGAAFEAASAALDRIEGQLTQDPAAACQAAIALIDRLGREVAWLAGA